jgi:transcriptional regulator with XRE-family HTH domain
MSKEKLPPSLIVAAAIKEALKRKGWYQAFLAKRIGVTPPVLNRTINQAKNPGLQPINEIAESLGYDLASFFALGQAVLNGEAPPPPPSPEWLWPLLTDLDQLDEAGQVAVKVLVKALVKGLEQKPKEASPGALN